MAPRKPNPSSVKEPDPGRIDDDTTAYLGISLIDDCELAKLVSSGALVEGQAFAPSKAIVPKSVDNRTVVFAIFFEAGLWFPCNSLLLEILRLFQVELPHLSPSALDWIAIFAWACRTSGFEPSAELFGAIFFATVNSKMPVNAAMSKWDRHWIARWFYHTIPFEAGSESAKALRCRCRAIALNREHKIAVDGAMEARFALLHKVCSRLSCRDLVDEFCMLRIFPLSQSWQVVVDQGEEVDGLPKLVLPEGMNVLTLDQADAEARKMIGDVSVVEYSQLLTRQAADRANRDDVEERDGHEEGEEEEEAEAVVEKAADEAVKNHVDTPSYTPTLSPGHNETGVESNSSPLHRKELEGAKALVAFSAGKTAKGGPVKKISKKKGLVDVARVFSDNESSDETPTSLAGRSLNLSTAPILSLDGGGAGGSAAAGASASADRIMTAVARVFVTPKNSLVIFELICA
uniref:Transposable element protein, putative n=2 Tax=Oryza sativa subsp. japonica TaxID=39947 RepID=Q2R7W0_ORYSJ|nr:Transposable element protein, putative [Oryza sativa Japonica Group]ABA92449.1 Transposable element protein, putative, Transposase_28 [Oryza sativa Japonica Group]